MQGVRQAFHKQLGNSLQVVVLKLSAAVSGRQARSAECCWHVSTTLLGE